MVHQPSAPLQGQHVYVDRTIFCRQGEQGQRKRLNELIKYMGGHISSEVDEADIILVHPARTSPDDGFVRVRGVIASYNYVEHCYEEKKTLPIANYVVPLRKPSPADPTANSQLDRDTYNGVELAMARPPQGVSVNKEHLSHPQQALGGSQHISDVDIGGSPTPSSVTLRSTRTTDDATSLEPLNVQLSPPIPTFRMPEHTAAFAHKDVRDWALEFLRWYTTYTPIRTDKMIVRGASVQLARIAPQLFKTTFQNVFAKGGEFSESVLQVIHSAKVLAERHSVKPMLPSQMDTLVKNAATEYRNEYLTASLSLSGSSTPIEDHPTEPAQTSAVLRPPRPPASAIFHRASGDQKRRVTEAGHNYMKMLWKWLLLRDPSQKRRDMAKDVAAISEGQLSQRAFDDYRKDNKSALEKIQNELETDPEAFRRNYDSDLTRTNSTQPRASEESASADREPARKRRKIDTQNSAPSTQPRDENGHFMSTSGLRRVPDTNRRLSLSPLSSRSSTASEDSDFYG